NYFVVFKKTINYPMKNKYCDFLKLTRALALASMVFYPNVQFASNITTHIEFATDEREILVTGTITDTNGLPLEGATIVIKGTDIWTETDQNGYFELKHNFDTATVLVIQNVGYSD